MDKGFNHVYFLINTTGGTVDHGVNLYNVLSGLPVRITTHNVSSVDSIGNIMFLSGDERFACQHSNFMFHGAGFTISKQVVRFEEKDVKEKYESLRSDNGILSDIISKQTNLTSQEIEEMFFKGTTLESSDAKAKGIIHDIKEVTLPKGAPFAQIVL